MQNDETLLPEIQKEYQARQNGTYRKPRQPRAKKVVKSNLKLKVMLVTVIVTGLFIFGYWFRTNYHFQQPVLISFQLPWAKNEVERVLVPMVMGQEVSTSAKPLDEAGKKAYMRTKKYPVILAGVRFRESTNGKNPEGHHNYCNDAGGSNEYGFNVYGENAQCFTSFEEATDAVDSWFDKHLKTLSVDQALCLYNQGGDGSKSDCKYAHDYRVDEPKVWAEFNK